MMPRQSVLGVLLLAILPAARADDVSLQPLRATVRVSDGKPLGSYRWLVWAVFPINDSENTVYQELQVIPAHER